MSQHAVNVTCSCAIMTQSSQIIALKGKDAKIDTLSVLAFSICVPRQPPLKTALALMGGCKPLWAHTYHPLPYFAVRHVALASSGLPLMAHAPEAGVMAASTLCSSPRSINRPAETASSPCQPSGLSLHLNYLPNVMLSYFNMRASLRYVQRGAHF